MLLNIDPSTVIFEIDSSGSQVSGNDPYTTLHIRILDTYGNLYTNINTHNFAFYALPEADGDSFDQGSFDISKGEYVIKFYPGFREMDSNISLKVNYNDASAVGEVVQGSATLTTKTRKRSDPGNQQPPKKRKVRFWRELIKED